MDCFGDYDELCDIVQHLKKLISYREQKGVGVLEYETPRRPRILWMMPVVEMNLPSLLEDAGARITGWEIPHLADENYDLNLDPLTSMAQDFLRFPLLGDCELRLAWLKRFLEMYPVDGIVYSSIWSCTQMPLQSGIVKDFLRTYNIPMLILDGGLPGNGLSGQMRTRIEAFVENLTDNYYH
jgi:benzoyl-CoA reductase/2-hydroxyglutaryl-CoA dehydratase subunit BcrC/BadD/HgdB